MNKPTLITVTILTLLTLGVWFYNSNYGIGRYQLKADGNVMIDTKTGTLYNLEGNEYNKIYFDKDGYFKSSKKYQY